MSELLRAQTGFAAALRNSSGEERALPFLAGDETRNRELLAVYRGNAVANATTALSLAYPVIAQIVGAEFFQALCRRYWAKAPSRSGDLNEYGAGFAAFLADFEHVRDLPYLADVAAMEWGVHLASAAADHAPVGLSELALIAPEALTQLQFMLQPSLQLMQSEWPLASIWQQHQAGYAGELDIDLAVAQCIAVHRIGLRAQVSALSAAELHFWQGAQRGEVLAAMLEAAFEADAQFDVQSALQKAFANEFVVALRTAPAD